MRSLSSWWFSTEQLPFTFNLFVFFNVQLSLPFALYCHPISSPALPFIHQWCILKSQAYSVNCHVCAFHICAAFYWEPNILNEFNTSRITIKPERRNQIPCTHYIIIYIHIVLLKKPASTFSCLHILLYIMFCNLNSKCGKNSADQCNICGKKNNQYFKAKNKLSGSVSICAGKWTVDVTVEILVLEWKSGGKIARKAVGQKHARERWIQEWWGELLDGVRMEITTEADTL